jgi:large subunit ribosomal protein L6
VQVDGPKGSLNWKLPEGINATLEENILTIQRASELKQYKALHGLARSLIANMVTGVSEGFEKKLRVVGMGYRAEVDREKNLVLDVGYSHSVIYSPPEGVTLSVEPTESINGQAHTPVIVSGIDKQLVGQVAASIRQIKKPEIYKPCKGIRYDGERVREKEGKAAIG